jgi:hypothetical protein
MWVSGISITANAVTLLHSRVMLLFKIISICELASSNLDCLIPSVRLPFVNSVQTIIKRCKSKRSSNKIELIASHVTFSLKKQQYKYSINFLLL